jgi:uncharacterized damage-inducible protein DinB
MGKANSQAGKGEIMGDETIYTAQNVLEHWIGHRRLSRRTLELFPEDQLFTFSIGGMRPFGKLALEMLMILPTLRGVATGEWKFEAAYQDVTDKAALLAAWDDCDAKLHETWAEITPERLNAVEADNFWMPGATPNSWKVQYWIDNEIHHRGQGYVYLRALGIEPPAFWER